MNLYFVIILFVVLIIWIIIHNLRKSEGMCDKKCKPTEDCSGTDLSNCLVGIESCEEPEPAEPIKCIADFGTSVGDPLCCGQDGVLQDTRYVCPNTMKKCQHFKCGSAFGTCVSE
jgi:hypothetical protein